MARRKVVYWEPDRQNNETRNMRYTWTLALRLVYPPWMAVYRKE